VIVADDQTLVREGLAMLVDIEPDIDVVGQASDGAEAVELARQLRPDVVVMDIRMPILDGIEATRRLIERFCLLPAPVSGTPGPLRLLTERELDVLRLLAEGLSNTDIASRLVVGVSTVKTHVAHIMTKLQLDERAQLVVLAYETGFVVPGRQRT
jgi:DNA-binding NarL/FixJ family response regulator